MQLAKRDKLGRPTVGFSYVNRKGLNAGKRQVKEFDDQLHIVISREDRRAISVRAKQKGVGVAELVRTYITWGLENDLP
jgi:hypothetical protein